MVYTKDPIVGLSYPQFIAGIFTIQYLGAKYYALTIKVVFG